MIRTKKSFSTDLGYVFTHDETGYFCMKRIMLAILLAAPGALFSEDISNPPGEQVSVGDCRDCPCEHCGCQAHCQKICHPVCQWKDVKETVYTCRCTDICIPGRSEKQCTVVDECNPYNCPLAHDYKPLYTLWNPAQCARTRSVTKLVKLEVTHKVPVYKWVVEYCCDSCRQELTQNAATPNADGPQQAGAMQSVGAVQPAGAVQQVSPGQQISMISQQ
jgi:hypothetical protein